MSSTDTTPNGAIPAEPATMPLLEHLKELRTRLIRVFLALFITTGISFVFAKQLFLILMIPLGDAKLQALRPTETLGSTDDNSDAVHGEGECPMQGAQAVCDVGDTKYIYYDGELGGLEIGCGFQGGDWIEP